MSNKKNALADYIEVNVRIEKFWSEYPDGRISTEILKLENGMCIIKAEIYKNIIDQHPSSIGHAYEMEGSSFINKTSYIENCETSAVGRGLALMGYEIKKSIASLEEVQNAKLQQRDKENEELEKFIEVQDQKNGGSNCMDCKVPINSAVKTYSNRYYGKALCRDCQGKNTKVFD